MIHHFIHEITVVTHHDHTTGEVLKIFFQNLQRHNIQVVRRLIKHQEVGVLHQHRTEIQFPALSTAQLIHIVMLLFGRKEEILQKLGSREMLTATHINIFRNVLYDIDYFLLLIKLQSFLREITEAHSIANVKTATVWRHHPQEHFDKGGFTRTVIAHDTHFLETGKVIVEILQDHLVIKSLRHILTLEDLRTNIDIARLQANLTFLNALFRYLLQFVESLFSISGLVSSGLRHTAHPFQLSAIQVVGSCDLCPLVV